MVMKKILAVVALWCGLGTAVWAEELSSSAAIGVAGEQRMYSQRIVKAWSQIGLNLQPADAKQQLDDATQRFENNLQDLAAVAVSPASKAALAKLNQSWQAFRPQSHGAISKERALALSQAAEPMLAAAERLTRILQDESKVPVGRLINEAGRQRMLSQRLAKAYMLFAWGVGGDEVQRELKQTAQELSDGLEGLLAAPENTPEIRAKLEELQLQWTWLKTAVDTEGALSYRLIVTEASEEMLVLSQQLVAQYQQLAR
jgi:nitrate/nitrite-specific signal transduction histidine kinase